MNEPSLQAKYDMALDMLWSLLKDNAELRAELEELKTYKWMYEELKK